MNSKTEGFSNEDGDGVFDLFFDVLMVRLERFDVTRK